MCFVAYYRYVNFHGRKEARLSSDQTVFGFQPNRTYLIKTMSILFFYAPELHLRGAHDRRVLFVYAETLSNRVGIRLRGFRHSSPQVGGVCHKGPV